MCTTDGENASHMNKTLIMGILLGLGWFHYKCKWLAETHYLLQFI